MVYIRLDYPRVLEKPMKAQVAFVSGITAFSQFPDELRSWFPSFFEHTYKSLGIPSDDRIIHKAVVALSVFVLWKMFEAIRRYIGNVIRVVAYKDAMDIAIIYRADRVAGSMPGRQIAAALNSLATVAYVFTGYLIFDTLIIVPSSDIEIVGIWKMFQFVLLMIMGGCCLLAMSRLRSLNKPASRLRSRAERKLRENLTKLGIPEEDEANPANGIAARIAKIDAGHPLAGLSRKYGRGRRRVVRRLAARLFKKM